MEIRWDLALWFMLHFADINVLRGLTVFDEMEYYFVRRALYRGDLDSVEQYVRCKRSLSSAATEVLAEYAAKDTKFYHWYMDTYLPLVQEG